ncbi:MAG: ATP-binding protein [Candidatus Zixiibacteriota bacterium]
MNKKPSGSTGNSDLGHQHDEDFRALSHKILDYANRGMPRIDFAREVCKILSDFSGCDSVELRLKRHDKYYLCEMSRGAEQYFRVEHLPCTKAEDGMMIPCSPNDSGIESLCRAVILGQHEPTLPSFTKGKSLWIGDTRNLQGFRLQDDFKSLALFPLVVDENDMGLLQLKSRHLNHFRENEIQLYEELASTVGIALTHRRVQVALRERIKELTCLYGIARLAGQPDLSLEEILHSIAELLPPAWLYPEITSGKIVLDGRYYDTPGFKEGQHNQKANIIIMGEKRGFVEVTYTEEKPELDEGPFLKEERHLIDTIAREVATIIQRRQAEEEKTRLQNQLMHADRLATIGQLAAGVAHELNEPLGSILGFAQLAKKSPELPKQAAEDIDKIESASLHAREVIKKLMLFARQMPPQKIQVDLNQLVEEGLYFLESRCAKEGIELVRSLSPNLPEIIADRGQLTQVLVNLIVNAVQAMPEGGKLSVRTLPGKQYVSLIVEDTGVGMSKEVVKKIFIPFFTTKEVDQGTGLGLAVVHGIVSSHGGSISVDSRLGLGTRFEIKLPLTGAPDVEGNDPDD